MCAALGCFWQNEVTFFPERVVLGFLVFLLVSMGGPSGILCSEMRARTPLGASFFCFVFYKVHVDVEPEAKKLNFQIADFGIQRLMLFGLAKARH